VTGKSAASATTVPNPSVAKPGKLANAPEPTWLGDYAEAWSVAEREGKMLLVYFRRSGGYRLREEFERQTLADPDVRRE